MEIIDLQVHEPAPFGDWAEAPVETRRAVLTEALWQTMDAVGVDAAVINPLEEQGWCEELSASFPDKIAWVYNCHLADIDQPDVSAHLAGIKARPGVIGVRFEAVPTHGPEAYERLRAGHFDKAFAACEEQGIPIWLGLWGVAGIVADIAQKFPGMQIVVDHIGINQPPYHPRDNPPWQDLGLIIELARNANVALKLCGAPSLSDQGFPWTDAWEQVARLRDAYGADRLAWASDIQRFRGRSGFHVRLVEAARDDARAQFKFGPGAHVPSHPPGFGDYPGKHTYMDSLAFILYNTHLDAAEKAAILGGSTRRLMNWPGRRA